MANQRPSILPLARSPSSSGSGITYVEPPTPRRTSTDWRTRPRSGIWSQSGVETPLEETDDPTFAAEKQSRDISQISVDISPPKSPLPQKSPSDSSATVTSDLLGPAYQYHFFDPEITQARRGYLRYMLTIVVVMFLAMWMSLPAYWASVAHAPSYAFRLRGFFINRDGPDGALGRALKEAFKQNSYRKDSLPSSKKHMTWVIRETALDGWLEMEKAEDDDRSGNAKDLEDLEDDLFDLLGYDDDDYEVLDYYSREDRALENAVIEEHIWAAVVVNYNATARLVKAREIGDTTYDPASAITFIYSQARNEIAADSYIVPLTTKLLHQTLQAFSANFTSAYMASLTSMEPDASRLALQNIAKAPQTISNPFYFATNNVRPYSAPVAEAILFVGQIYILIFTYNATTHHAHARSLIQRHLKFRSYAVLRLITPFLLYIPVSLSYAMISLPFHMPFDARWKFSVGFLTYWLYTYLGMVAFGMACEAAVTILTLRLGSFFLIFLLITSLATASLPIKLQPDFYTFGYSYPIYNVSQAIRTIIFNTRNYLPQNAAVLVAWILLSSLITVLASWGWRWWEKRGLIWWQSKRNSHWTQLLRNRFWATSGR